MQFYSLPYLLLILTYIFIFKLETQGRISRKRINLLCCFLYFLFFAFRGNIGSDWYNYRLAYEVVSWQNSFLLGFEPGFVFLMKAFKGLSLSYNAFLIGITFFQSIMLFNIVNFFSKNIAFAYILVVSLFPIAIIDLLRNYTALLIVFSGVPLLLKGNIKYFVLLVFIACSIHITSIVFLFCIYLVNRTPDNRFLLICFLVGLLVYFVQFDIIKSIVKGVSAFSSGRIGELLAGVMSDSESSYGVSLGIVEKIFFFFIVFTQSSKEKAFPRLFINMFYIYVFLYLFFSTSQTFINRFSILFMFGYIFTIIYFLYRYRDVYKLKLLIPLVLAFVLLRTYLSYNNILYEYSNNIISNDDIDTRETNRYYYYLDRES